MALLLTRFFCFSTNESGFTYSGILLILFCDCPVRKIQMAKLFPDDYIESTYVIDFRALYSEGYRALLFDVDNTLVPHNAPADERAIAFFSYVKGLGYKCMFLSNNKEPRVKTFCEAVGGDGYIYKAGKPKATGYLEACRRLDVAPEHTLFVGDQILTDIWGANNAGIRSVLVKPVKKWYEEPQIVLKRFLEAAILLGYRIYTAGGRHVKKVPLKKEGENLQ